MPTDSPYSEAHITDKIRADQSERGDQVGPAGDDMSSSEDSVGTMTLAGHNVPLGEPL